MWKDAHGMDCGRWVPCKMPCQERAVSFLRLELQPSVFTWGRVLHAYFSSLSRKNLYKVKAGPPLQMED